MREHSAATHRSCGWVDRGQIGLMSSPIFDFSHLSPEERIQLAEERWASLTPGDVALDPDLVTELERRAEVHRREPERGSRGGRPWMTSSSAAHDAALVH